MNSISVKCPKLSLRSGVLVSPSNCRSSNQAYGSTCSFSCARGYRLSGPSSTQCGKGGVWNQRSSTVRCEGEKLLMTWCAQYNKVTIKTLQFASKVRESWLEKIVTTLKADSNSFFFFFIVFTLGRTRNSYPHRGTRGRGGGNWWNPSPEFLICCSISKRFCFQWKTFDLFKKMSLNFMNFGVAVGLWRHQQWTTIRLQPR